MMKYFVLVAAILGGCASSEPPPVPPDLRLADPPAWAMRVPVGPSDIPVGDGDPKVRRDFLANERENHASCVDRYVALRAIIVAERRKK